METELFDLVLQVQNGDSDAMQQIISCFKPIIRSARSKFKLDRQDDLEQNIIETIMGKILTYDINKTPGFTEFCCQLLQNKS
ncbi:helix-turn-helix domain-containing protein [Paenibacillus sp. NPDC057934]|uniref:helix-turn-helix domain-containing protein n=1 Tax=Paenibacillus sp. NPDC057934 TaxID=3346282 RepID=UPI0036D82EDD